MNRPLIVLALAVCSGGAWLIGSDSADTTPGGTGGPATALKMWNEPPSPPELASLMSQLQVLTHKLALSANAGNAPLTAFYLHESVEQLRLIQKEAPEYESHPIAVLIGHMALPAYADLEKSASAPSASRDALLAGVDRVVQGCNDCHTATQHGFIHITRGTDFNPFNQSFQP